MRCIPRSARRFVIAAAAFVLSAGASEAPAAEPAARADATSGPPNIVLIVADDLGWNGVGYQPNSYVETPNIDRIANQGVRLDRFYVSPMCSPTRAGLLTGRYPMRYGMARTVVRPWIPRGLPPEERTLPEALADAGYRHRGAFGKWHLGHLKPQYHPLAQGFTQFEGMYNGAGNYFNRDRDSEMDWHVDAEPTKKDGYTTNLVADAASAFVRAHAKDGPFFCYVPFSAPHDPFQAPTEYIEKFKHLDDDAADGKPGDFQVMCAMITCMDDGIGRIMKAVEESGAAGNTLYWFMSDNGGIARFPQNNAPLRAGKLTVYEGGVRVPACAWLPGRIEGGRTVDTPVVNVDVMPTLLSLAGAKAEPSDDRPLDGVDVSALLTGASGSAAPNRDLYFFDGQQGLEEEKIAVTAADGWKLVVVGPDVRRPEGIGSDKHKVELFDLSKDPYEKNDLAAAEPARVKELAAKAIAFRNSEPADGVPTRNRKPADFRPPPQWRNAPPVAAAR